MAIKNYYTIICELCNKEYWMKSISKDTIRTSAVKDGWHTYNGDDYCPDCAKQYNVITQD